MQSQEHAVLVDLFRAAPRLALDLLRALGASVSNQAALSATPRVIESTFPVIAPDYHVDLALACEDEHGDPELVVLVEVQLDVDWGKLRSWPLYQAAARARFKCDACVLVVTIEQRVAAWAAAPVRLGPGGSVFGALVIGPSSVPRWLHGDAKEAPELALLSALCCGESEPDLVATAVESIAKLEELDPKRGRAYFDLLRYHLGEALDRALEAIMATSEHKYLSDFARKYYGEGKAEGKAEGIAEGKAEGAREALLTAITARGLVPGDGHRARIASCADVATLNAWLVNALGAKKMGDVFGA
jgi:hypothetical protein